MKIVKSLDTSHWMARFQAHQISEAIKAKCPVNIIPISRSSRMLLRKMKRVLPLPAYFSELELAQLLELVRFNSRAQDAGFFHLTVDWALGFYCFHVFKLSFFLLLSSELGALFLGFSSFQ